MDRSVLSKPLVSDVAMIFSCLETVLQLLERKILLSFEIPLTIVIYFVYGIQLGNVAIELLKL